MNIRFRHTLPILLILAASMSGFVGCSREQATASQASPPPPVVTVSKPLQQRVTHYESFTGTTEALAFVTVRARVEGVLDQVHFVPGSRVKEGDLLFSIDDDPYRARLEEARADLVIRKAELALAETTCRRRELAYKNRAVSEVAVMEAQAALSTAKAAVAAAKASVNRAELDLSYTRITAPISGRIGRTLVDLGNLVGAGERTELTTIVQDDSVYLYFTVNEKDLLRYRQLGEVPSPVVKGTPVSLSLSGGADRAYKGTIEFIGNHVDTATGTLRVRGLFSNDDGRLLPGLFARVKIPVGKERLALMVPETSLGRDQQGDFLLVADFGNLVVHRKVTKGPLVNEMRVISSGIEAGDRVIVNGLQKAFPGAPVTPVEENNSVADNGSTTPSA